MSFVGLLHRPLLPHETVGQFFCAFFPIAAENPPKADFWNSMVCPGGNVHWVSSEP